MPRFSVATKSFGEFPTIELNDSETGASSVFSLRGATLLSYAAPLKSGPVNIIDGFETPQELADRTGGRSMIMTPFSNRIDKGVYQFGGREYALKVVNPQRNVAIHGFLGSADFTCTKSIADDTVAEIVLVSNTIRTGVYEGYPFDADVEVTARLSARGLTMEIAGINLGNEAIPFGCGWHPYFKTGENGIEHVKITVPARTAIAVTDRLIPLAGTDAFVPVAKGVAGGFDVSSGREIKGQVIDNAFTDLIPDTDGIIRTRIEDHDTRIRITVTQQRGLMHVFTGDTLPTRMRKSIALEPVEFMTNAFARPDCADRIILKPKERRAFAFGVYAENI